MPPLAARPWLPALLLLAPLACSRAPEPEPSPRPAPAAPASAAALDAVVFTTGGAGETDALPLIVALHGLGDRPESFSGWLRALPARARVAALRAPRPHGRGHTWFEPTGRGGGAVDPAALGPGAREAAALVAADLPRLLARWPSRGKPIVTGFSQGGMISFTLAALYPDAIAAALPIGSVLPTAIEPPQPSAAAPLLVAFHGADDERVPAALARTSIERFRARGWTADLRSYPGVAHSIGNDERRDLLQALSDAASLAAR